MNKWCRSAVIAGAVLAGTAAQARADWPCTAGEAHYRIARSPKGGKPIAIGAFDGRPLDNPVYGALVLEDLNADGRADVVFQSACIRGATPSDSVRLHRVFASCGANAKDGIEDFVMIYDEEELCSRPIKIASVEVAKPAVWRALVLAKQTPREGKCLEASTTTLAFDGRKYVASPAVVGKRCPTLK